MKDFIIRTLFLILIIQTPIILLAQEEESDHRNEVGAGFALTTFSDGAGFSPTFHLHYSRSFSENSLFALTGGFEMITGDHQHNTLGIGISYKFWKEFSFDVSPGISFAPEEDPEAGLHFELSYGFEWGKLHLGPMVEYGLGADHSHTAFGIHTGFGF
jgi:hypothetical protein